MLTRKHFKAMAKLISVVKDLEERKKQAIIACRLCSDSNPRFDTKRFLEACGVKQ